MSAPINLIGQRFGRLSVTSAAAKSDRGERWWDCTCDCGTAITRSTGRLRAGKTKSCGCLQRETMGSGSRINLTGRRYGRLTVIEVASSNRHGGAQWKCFCDCGETVVISANCLKAGDTESCGCLKRDRVSAASTERHARNRLARIETEMFGDAWQPCADSGTTRRSRPR